MAVYKKTYRPYDGPLTAAWSRFLIMPRYAFEDMRSRRFLSTFFVASMLYRAGLRAASSTSTRTSTS